MKNYRLLVGILLIFVFLFNIGYQFQSFASASNSPTKGKANQTAGGTLTNTQTVVKAITQTKTDVQSSQNYQVSSQEQRPSSGSTQNGLITKSSTNSVNTVTVTNSSGSSYNTTWYNKDWKYRENITISAGQFTANEINFPLLLDFYDTNLKLALNSGYDILFTDSANHKLDYERITFDKNYNSTDAHIRVWVKGNWSTTGNTIMMYFGNPFSPDQQNPKGTWSNGYAAVYHLNGNPQNKIIDSTGNYNGTAYTGNSIMPSSYSLNGVVSNGIYFDGNSNITLGNINSNAWTGLTLEAWANVATLKVTTSIVTKQDSSTNVWTIATGKSGKFNDFMETNSAAASVSNFPSTTVYANTWYSLGLTWSASSNALKAFYNGAQSGSTVTTTGTSILNSSLLASIGSYGFNGIIDEVRISSVSRSAAWIADTNKVELTPSSFLGQISTLEKIQLEGNWSFNQLQYRKAITISNASITQTYYNYPFLITRTDSNLSTYAQVSGGDILFADANGTRIDQEIESYSKGTSTSTIVVWLKLPILSSTNDTIIYMYYGNSTVKRYVTSNNVWSNYRAVWHLSDTGTTIKDSTGNGYNGVSNGNVVTSGKIAEAQSFNGNNFISVSSSTLSTGSDVYITGWFKLNSAFNSSSSKTQLIMSKYLNSTYNAYIALVGNDFNSLTSGVPKGSLLFKAEQGLSEVYTWTNQTSWSPNIWYQFSVILHTTTPTTNKIYVNGADNTNTSYSVCVSCQISIGYTASWNFGGGTIDSSDVASQSAPMNGSLDELRITNNIPLASEIYFTYSQESNPASYYSFSSQRYFDFSPPQIIDFNVTDPGNGYPTFWAKIYEKSSIVSSYISINNTIHSLAFNGTKYGYTSFYTFQFSQNVTYNNFYNYSIINATDSLGYFQSHATPVGNYTANYVSPSITVSNWDYYPNDGNNGTFVANVSDGWPGLSYVQVYVNCTVYCPSPTFGNMTSNTTIGGFNYVTGAIYLIGQIISFKIVAFDLAGNNYTTGYHQRTVNNRPPVISNAYLYSASTNRTIYSNETLSLAYTYTDPENDTDNSLIYWYKNSTLQPAYNNSLGVPNTEFKKGDNWFAQIIGYDGHGYGNTINTSTITIQNTPPTVTASLKAVQSNQILIPTYSASDYDLDSLTYSIWWYNGSTIISALNNTFSVPASYLKKNETWHFGIAVSDGQNTTYKYSNNVIIKNTPPTLTGTPGINASVSNSGGYIFANYSYLYFDYDGDLENITPNFSPYIKWFFNGTYYPAYDNLTKINLDLTQPQNSLIYYTVQVYDGANFSIVYTSATCKEGSFADPSAPTITNLYFANSYNYTCDNNCTSLDSIGIYYTYSDQDGSPEFGTLYRWYLDVAGTWQLQSQYNDMKILPNGTFIHGQVWYVNVTPSDGTWFINSVLSGNLTIADILPVFSSPSIQVIDNSGNYISATNTTTDKTLYATWTVTDADGDTITWESYWTNGTLTPSNYYNSSSLPSNFTLRGQTWNFSIRAWDGYNWTSWLILSITIIDSAPVISSLTIAGGQNVTQTLSLTYSFSDLDLDPKDAIIIWYVNGQATETNSTIFSNFKAGDLVYAVVTGWDGQLTGNTLSTLKITIGDAIPYITTIYMYQGNNQTSSFYVNSSLNVFFTTTDNDSYQTNYGIFNGSNYYLPGKGADYEWYLNGTLNSTNYYIPSSYLIKGDNWSVCVRPRDQALEVGIWYCLANINISDSAPVVSPIVWNDYYPTTQTNLQISFSTSDVDNDALQTYIIWYVNETPVEYNSLILNSGNFSKNQNVTVFISVFDGQIYTNVSSQIIILDSLPIVTSMSINNNTNIYTNDSLTLYWGYYDVDGDNQSSKWIINWYMILNFQTYNETSLINQTSVSPNFTAKGEVWYALIRVYDGQKYSIVYDSRAFGSYYILNSRPEITSIFIDSPGQSIYTNNSLLANYKFYDADNDPNYLNKIYVKWFLDGVWNQSFNNMTLIDFSYTVKGQSWYYEIEVFDGTAYSVLYTSPTITIQDSKPYTTNYGLRLSNGTINTLNFVLSDQNITFYYNFIDIDNDTNHSVIYWYKNGFLQTDLNNTFTLSNALLHNGDTWSVLLVLSDGQITESAFNVSTIIIIGAPYISSINASVPEVNEDKSEGVYDIYVQTNTTYAQVEKVVIVLNANLQNDSQISYLINSLSNPTYTITTLTNGTWEATNWDIFSGLSNRSLFINYIGKNITFEIIIYTTVIDPITHTSHLISRSKLYTMTIKDLSPPVVSLVTPKFDNVNNPTSITFTATVTDYGSGVKNVTLIYYFLPINQSAVSSSLLLYKLSSLSQTSIIEFSVQLLPIGNNLYQATVPFHGNSSINVFYTVVVYDKDGNANLNAYPQGSNTPLSYVYKAGGYSNTTIAIIIGLVLLIAGFATFVGIKKFRKTEIVGLDVEKVMKETSKFSDLDVKPNLNSHTLGIVLSIFHQTHGPLPIFALPTVLTDNLEKLIDLSDRSFSAVRFVENFTNEMQISYDYSISSSIRISSMSWGFSLDRPDARGGAENITLNIMVHKPYDVIINQFIAQLDPFVHEIHMILNEDEENKELIEKKISELRNLTSRIIMSYQAIYPEGVEQEEDIFDTAK